MWILFCLFYFQAFAAVDIIDFTEPHLVEVLPTALNLYSYRERRPRWGKTIAFGGSTYQPSNYESFTSDSGGNAIAVQYNDIYQNKMPMFESSFVVKRNLAFGSLGAEVGVGFRKDSGTGSYAGSSLTTTLIRLGGAFYLDTIFAEPYVVPYVSAGVYTIVHYENSETVASPNGHTGIAPYMTAGVQVQLDGIDRDSARAAYNSSGLESAFVYLEARTFLNGSEPSGEDVSSPFHGNLGMRLEF